MNSPIPPEADWLKFNVDQFGYYRVNYPEDDWNRFGELLMTNPGKLSNSDRTSLLNDAFALANADRYELH